LGAYIIKDLLDRTSRAVRLITHVRGAKSPKAAFERLRRSLEGHGIWQDSWSTRLSCVVGDLSKPQLGMDQNTWHNLAHEVDVVIHNGRMVHWMRKYQDMMATNVLSTIDTMSLCNTGKSKLFAFVSSTSTLDTDHYVKLSQKQISTGEDAISEDDDLQGSSTGLGTGYGQTG
jgi:L-2-aminoadipate reductase